PVADARELPDLDLGELCAMARRDRGARGRRPHPVHPRGPAERRAGAWHVRAGTCPAVRTHDGGPRAVWSVGGRRPRGPRGRPGLVPRLAAIYGAPDVFEAVGAVLAGEIFGKQVDQLLGDEFRRQTLIDPESLAWLSLHETLEVAHADASQALAALVPPHAVK